MNIGARIKKHKENIKCKKCQINSLIECFKIALKGKEKVEYGLNPEFKSFWKK